MERGKEILYPYRLHKEDQLTGVISYPIPAYQNLQIDSQFYQPSRFVISAITLGLSTTVETSSDHNYVVGQLVRLLVPRLFGSYQLNEVQGYVISAPTATSVVLDIDSTLANAFIASPYTCSITNITQDTSAVVTASNSFLRGNSVIFSGVGGMTEINTLVGSISAVSGSGFTVAIDSSSFSAYSGGGTATLYGVPQDQAQIVAIGDVNSGITSSTGPILSSTAVPGSFINISPS